MAAIKELIQAATIARVTSKAGEFLGFLVKSNHTNEYYEITCLKIDGQCEFFCSCVAKEYGCSECCHIKAVKELVAARKELAKAKHEADLEACHVIAEQKAAKALIRQDAGRPAFKKVVAQVRAIEAKYTPPALNGRGFRVEAVKELGGIRVPMKVA